MCRMLLKLESCLFSRFPWQARLFLSGLFNLDSSYSCWRGCFYSCYLSPWKKESWAVIALGCGLWREERKFELLQYLPCGESFEHPEFLEIVIWSFRCPTIVLTVNYFRALLLVDCYTICPLNMPCLSLSPSSGKQELILFFHITPKTSLFFCLVCSSRVSPDD